MRQTETNIGIIRTIHKGINHMHIERWIDLIQPGYPSQKDILSGDKLALLYIGPRRFDDC